MLQRKQIQYEDKNGKSVHLIQSLRHLLDQVKRQFLTKSGFWVPEEYPTEVLCTANLAKTSNVVPGSMTSKTSVCALFLMVSVSLCAYVLGG